jgi:hypothetical protein
MSESRKRKPTPRKQTTTPAPASPASSGDTRDSSDTSTEPNVLGLEPDTFDPPENPVPADADLTPDYEPEPAELLEWTPERAGAIVRAGGFVLHTADGMSREPEGGELWRATEADVDAIAPPLSRILNRYAPARRLAGVTDEFELAVGVMAYARENLAERGRIVTAKRKRDEIAEQADASGTWPEPEPPPA